MTAFTMQLRLLGFGGRFRLGVFVPSIWICFGVRVWRSNIASLFNRGPQRCKPGFFNLGFDLRAGLSLLGRNKILRIHHAIGPFPREYERETFASLSNDKFVIFPAVQLVF